MFYHIRFLKTPRIIADNLFSVITITNDLGDIHFYGNAQLTAELIDGNNVKFHQSFQWIAGNQALKININRHNFDKISNIFLRLSITDSHELLYDEKPEFFPVLSALNSPIYVTRRLNGLKFFEEPGTHNLARHLWDAGIALSMNISKYLNQLTCSTVVELGTGCGITGIRVSKDLKSARTVLLSDKIDAKEICEENIRQNDSSAKFVVYEWGTEPPVNSTGPDTLILVTDCTYNTSSYSALISSIKRFNGSWLLLAHKYRNEDEEEFFRLLLPYMDIQSDELIDFYGQKVRIIFGIIEN